MKSVALLSFVVASSALATSTGVNGVGPTGCNQCHNGGTAPVVTLGPPTSLDSGKQGDFSLTVTATNGNFGGFFVTANQMGTFATGITQQRLTPSGITHSTPVEKDALSGLVTFPFKWTPAASVQGNVVFTGWGNSVNSANGQTGDRAASQTLTVCVRAASANACAGAKCGMVSDACGGQLVCPTTCSAPQTCGGGGTANVCGCSPLTQAVACAGKNCGKVDDGCGATLDCGSCGAGRPTCGGAGTANVCGCSGAVLPEICNGFDDDCNGQVDDGNNICAAGQSCVNMNCVATDAGQPDSGVVPVDAGTPDAGVKDAGVPDSGSAPDSGAPAADAGNTAPPKEEPRGCGCGAGSGPVILGALGLLVALGGRRRRAGGRG